MDDWQEDERRAALREAQARWKLYQECLVAGLSKAAFDFDPHRPLEGWEPSRVPDSLEAWCRGEDI